MRCAIVFAMLCACAPVARDLPDGLYVVAREGVRVESDEGPPVTLRRSPSVPMIIDGEPVLSPDGKGRHLLSVALEPEAASALERFTRENVGGSAAIVLGGRVITVHKIKSVITGGGMQISRCGDDRCQVLRSRLLSR